MQKKEHIIETPKMHYITTTTTKSLIGKIVADDCENKNCLKDPKCSSCLIENEKYVTEVMSLVNLLKSE